MFHKGNLTLQSGKTYHLYCHLQSMSLGQFFLCRTRIGSLRVAATMSEGGSAGGLRNNVELTRTDIPGGNAASLSDYQHLKPPFHLY